MTSGTGGSSEKKAEVDVVAIPTSDSAFEPTYTTEEDRQRVLRKMDWHLLPFISFLYLLSFLDRSNIGNARIAGMATDLELTGLKYNVVAAVFFIPYSLAEVPSNVALKLVRPSIWIPSTMVAWGIVMTLMCLCNTYEGLIVARVFLGLTEAGLFPGIAFYLSLWYRRQDVARRIAIFFSAATVAGAFGGLLAFGIAHMDGIGGLQGWQWIFCLEGIVTVFAAVSAFFYMHDYPETATFLNTQERAIIVHMLQEDTMGLDKTFRMAYVWHAIGDYKTYLLVGIYLGLLVPVYSISLFTPTIVRELGFSAANAQLLTIPPFVAGCIATIAVGVYSDKFNKRGPFIVGGCSVSMIGYLILISQSNPIVSYFGAILTATGVYPCIPIIVAWVGSSAGGDVAKGVVLAIVIGIANFGGVASSFIYLHGPRYYSGHGANIGFLTMSITLSCFAMWKYNRLNKRNERICQEQGIDDSRRDEFKNVGNDSPLFRFTI
ncbi:major facilitator superfamily domain-containing protein [Coprinopsis sp. MPI-PUGE-AT-0042]|nr:major facilitator superfamily domain-containing protein [Coprinopsis sp. MPI-PUGE-AT-0042]